MTESKGLTEPQLKNIKTALSTATAVLSAMPQTRPAVKVLTLLAVGAQAAVSYLENSKQDNKTLDVKVIKNDN